MNDFSHFSHMIVLRDNQLTFHMDLSIKKKGVFFFFLIFLEIKIVVINTVVNSSKHMFRKFSKIYFCANDVRLLQSVVEKN